MCPLKFHPQSFTDCVLLGSAITGAIIGTIIETKTAWEQSKTGTELMIRGLMNSAVGAVIGFWSGLILPFTSPFIAAYYFYRWYIGRTTITPTDTESTMNKTS